MEKISEEINKNYKHSVKIIYGADNIGHVIIDGEEANQIITRVSASISAMDMPRVVMDTIPEIIEFEGEIPTFIRFGNKTFRLMEEVIK